MPIVRVEFAETPELDIAPAGWRLVTCRKAVAETSQADNPMYVLTLDAEGFRQFRTWLLLPDESQTAYTYNRRLADIRSALRAFDVPFTEGGVLPWPGVPSREWGFTLCDFVDREARLWIAVKAAEKGYAARNAVEWKGRS